MNRYAGLNFKYRGCASGIKRRREERERKRERENNFEILIYGRRCGKASGKGTGEILDGI